MTTENNKGEMTKKTDDLTEYYQSSMHGKYGLILKAFFRIFFSKIKINDEHIDIVKDILDKGTPVYIMGYKSLLEYLLLNYIFLNRGLPLVKFANHISMILWSPFRDALRWIRMSSSYFFKKGRLPDPVDSGYLSNLILENQTTLIFLRKKILRGILRNPQKTDAIEVLVETQKLTQRPIFLIPQILIWERRPEKYNRTIFDVLFREIENPGIIRRLIVFIRNYRRAIIRMGDPINLQEYIKERNAISKTDLSKGLRLSLFKYFQRERRIIRGPVLKPRGDLIKRILTDPGMEKVIEESAFSEGHDIFTVRKNAEKILNKMASDVRFSYIELSAIILKWVWNNIYDGIHVNDRVLELIRKKAKDSTLILVPCHKSHVDYLLISYVLFRNNLIPPHIAAGINLSFWPLGHIFRSMGAFFIRRRFRGDRLYTALFSEYLKTLISEGYPVEFFIEGGRSRSGKLLWPRTGLLSMIFDSYTRDLTEDISFVPIFIGYERVIEEGMYTRELQGAEKSEENIKMVIKAPGIFRKKHGRVYVQFHEPLSLRDYLAGLDPPYTNMDKDSKIAVVRNFADRIISAINDVSLATPSAVVAASILTHPKRGILYHQLRERVDFVIDFLEKMGVGISVSLANRESAIEKTIANFKKDRLIRDFSDGMEERVLAINEAKRGTLNYYKNDIINHFAPISILAASILSLKDHDRIPLNIVRERFDFSEKIFRYEFVNLKGGEPGGLFSESLKLLIEYGCISENGSNGLNSSSGSNGLGKRSEEILIEDLDTLHGFHAFVQNFFESYYVVILILNTLKKEPQTERALIKTALIHGKRLYMTETITHPEALLKINFQNAIKLFHEEDVIGYKEEETSPKGDRDRKIHLIDEEKMKSYLEGIKVFIA